MARDFFPFVGDDDPGEGPPSETHTLVVRYPARIAVYDDVSAAPRVVVIEPQDVRPYLDEITATVSRLAREQGSTVPFMVIREIVENFIHSFFRQPTISILDDGNTLRFSDQGPGIKEKDRALQFGTSSATEEMRRYIRGVGSGLPYVQQYMQDKGGALTIEDNISTGTVVTISAVRAPHADTRTAGCAPQAAGQPSTASWPAQPSGLMGAGAAATVVPAASAPFGTAVSWPLAHPAASYQAQSQAGWPQATPGAMPSIMPGVATQSQGSVVWGSAPSAPLPAATYPTAPPWPSVPGAASADEAGAHALEISERGHLVLSFLRDHESVGPTDLMRAYGSSQPTWSRELSSLEDLGLVNKRRGEQKRRLSAAGRAFLAATDGDAHPA
ncbi:ATP-binding protein [Olsenella massiliensis]|uniref:ATP-binding protein n=1 Tax=Olsenella massiliensis TaxID=1622075 RepID=UPI00071CDA7D|nr:ATP-binding protein [Olsenella massiliensis]